MPARLFPTPTGTSGSFGSWERFSRRYLFIIPCIIPCALSLPWLDCFCANNTLTFELVWSFTGPSVKNVVTTQRKYDCSPYFEISQDLVSRTWFRQREKACALILRGWNSGAAICPYQYEFFDVFPMGVMANAHFCPILLGHIFMTSIFFSFSPIWCVFAGASWWRPMAVVFFRLRFSLSPSYY